MPADVIQVEHAFRQWTRNPSLRAIALRYDMESELVTAELESGVLFDSVVAANSEG